MKLSELIGLPVRTESDDSLGRVHDVRAELTPRTLKVTGLVVGGSACSNGSGSARRRRRRGYERAM